MEAKDYDPHNRWKDDEKLILEEHILIEVHIWVGLSVKDP